MIGQPPEGGRYVIDRNDGVYEIETFAALSFLQRRLELGAGRSLSSGAADRFGKSDVIPARQRIVVPLLVHILQHCISGVVEDDYYWIQAHFDGRAYLHAGHLEAAVADKNNRTAVPVGKLNA